MNCTLLNRSLFDHSLFAFLPATVLLLVLTPAVSRAQTTFQLIAPAQTGTQAGTLHFFGTLANVGDTDVFLNGDSLSLSGPGLSTDDSPFYTGSPLSLASVGSVDSMNQATDSYTGEFFSVTLDPAATPGIYYGTYSLFGGADASASDLLGSEDFSVTVPDSSPVPEASTTVSLGLLLVLGGMGVWRARRRKVATVS